MLVFSLTVLLVLRGLVICAAQGIEQGDYPYDEPLYSSIYKDVVLTATDPCFALTPPCLSEADRYSLEALRHIHREMDDDQDGGIEVEESVEFIIEDMQQQQQTNKHSRLHREDQHITVEELWRGWKSSEVHNWTQEDVLRWLREFVELPQYDKNFKELRANGNTLPRIAANEPSFMSVQLKIQDQQHKQKLKLKALDVVLFGPPTRPPHNWMKDLLLIVSVVMGIGGCWFAQVQNKASKVHISKMMKDLDSLQRAEQSLMELQEQLERAQEEKRTVAVEKQNLEEKMRDEIQGAQEEANRLHELRDGAVSELSRLRYAEEKLEQVRGALKRAEKDMQISWSVPEALQLWLQLTHEVEVQHYNVKKQSAEQQLYIAKEEAEKIKKKRNSVLGTLHVAHSSSLDEVDHKILEAKNALADVTACLRERLHRWQQIERLCVFPLMRNSGLASLTAILYPDPNWMLTRVSVLSYPMPAGVEDLEEDMAPMMSQLPVSPMKRSPRSLVCSRRPAPEPDILIPLRLPLPRYAEEEEDHIFLSPLSKEGLETSSSSESIGSSVSRKYPNSALDTPPRRKFREEDIFSDNSSRKIAVDEPEDSPSRKTSRDEREDSTRSLPRTMLSDEPNIAAEIPRRKISSEELEVAMDTPARMSARSELEVAMDTSTRKMGRDKMDDNPIRYLSRDKIDTSIDPHTGMMFRDEHGVDVGMDAQRRKMFRERMEVTMDAASRKILRDDLDVSMDTQRGKMGRDKRDVPSDVASRKMLRDEFDVSMDTHRGMMFRDKRDVPMDTTSRMLSRDELEAAAERKRMFWADGYVDTLTGKICREKVDVAVETPMRKISRDELGSTVPRFGQPDLTVDSRALWKPCSDPLSMLVYDGILEQSYHTTPLSSPAAPGDLAPPAFESPHSTVGGEGVPQRTPHPPTNTLSPEPSSGNGSGDKAKRSSRLKSLFKKNRKERATSEQEQGGLQKL